MCIRDSSITLPSFFSNRFRDNRKILQSIGAIFIVIFFIPYTASGFAACGKLFSSLFGVSYLTAMIISALVIVGYTTLGGFLAASTTDFIQSIIMSIALIIVFGGCFAVGGGPSAVIDHARSLPGYLTMMTTYDPISGTEAAYPLINIISMLAWGLGYFGMPHILLRFMAIEDEKKLSLSRKVATTWVVISLAVAVLIGVIGLGMTEAGKLEMLQGSASETIIVKIADLLSTYGIIPALLGGTILAGILASTMSTADSQLLAASSAVSSDLLGSILKKKAGKKAWRRGGNKADDSIIYDAGSCIYYCDSSGIFYNPDLRSVKSSDIRIDRQQYKNEQAVIQEWIGGDTKMDHSCNSRSRRENYVKCR